MALRIGLFAPYDLARAGGVNNQIRAQARALRRLGHHVQIAGPASAPLPDGEIALCRSVSVTVSGTESGLGVDPASAWRVARLLKETAFDLVHVHEPLTPVMPWFVLACARTPIVGTFHVHRENGHPFYPFGRPFLKPLMNRLSCRIAVSNAARATVARYFPGEYQIVPNGIEADDFRAPAARPALMADGRTRVLYVGRLEPRKGVAHLVRAMAAVQQSVADTALVIVGDGPDRDSLEALARSLTVRVTFAGRVSDADLPAYLQWSDIVCSPALGGESFGIVLLEAMVCSKPIVASRIDGYVGLAGDAGCGLFVPPGDSEALATALIDLLRSPERRREMGERGDAHARQYEWPTLARRIETLYEQVCATRVS